MWIVLWSVDRPFVISLREPSEPVMVTLGEGPTGWHPAVISP